MFKKHSTIRLFKPVIPLESKFMATMDILGHKFILRSNGHLCEKYQKMWFDSILDTLGVKFGS
jgi:hypothetical protein